MQSDIYDLPDKDMYNILEILKSVPFTEKFDNEKIEFLAKIAEITEANKGQVISKQFEQSHSFYLLLDGHVNFSISVENKTDEFSVGKSNEKFTPIGWSGFRTPGRYATTVRCEEKSVFIKWSHENLKKFFEQEPLLGYEFIIFVLHRSMNLLNHVRSKLAGLTSTDLDLDIGKEYGKFNPEENLTVPEPLNLLRQSPFFEMFPENIIRKLSKSAQKRWYVKGDLIYRQGEAARGIYILAYGNTAICFNGNREESENASLENSSVLSFIGTQGYIVGWAGGCDKFNNDITLAATRDSVIYFISKSDLNKIFGQSPELSLVLAKRLLWIVSIRLRNSRAGLISSSYEREIIAVSNIIEQNSTVLSVNSELHKIPHLLNNPITLDDSFKILFRLENEGTALEKGIARLILNILGKVYKEYSFFSGLKHVYQSVTQAPPELSHEEIRTTADKQFVGIFENVPHVIKGWENLPEKPGSIFIYNHLANHPYNTLPNNFQITLDSHFISSMILYKKYGQTSIRVVRVPKAEEYGHENYYERLGHINVYTKESELRGETREEKEARREAFYEKAGNYLLKRVNLALSPEGTSLRSDLSPGPFRPGAFQLAMTLEPEPFIVPIAIANFDKRINQNVFSVVIKKPFRISEKLKSNGNDREELFEFLENYRKEYKGYVEEAIEQAAELQNDRINLRFFEKVKKDPFVIDKNLFEKDIRVLERRIKARPEAPVIFYGSSSIRLWSTLKKDLGNYDIMNLGFGGSRIDYCRYYFDRLIKQKKLDSFVFYAGDNDVGDGRLPKQVLNSFVAFYHKFREAFPKARFTFVSIKPSPERFSFLERIDASNNLIKQFISNEPNTFYLNVFDEMLDQHGNVKENLFNEDGLHMNRKGYELWKKIFLENENNIFPVHAAA